MEALKSEHEAIGLAECVAVEANFSQLGDLALQTVFQNAQRSEIHPHQAVETDATGGTYDSAVGNKE